MRKITVLLLAVVLCLLLGVDRMASAAYTEGDEKHPIDVEHDKRLNEAETTLEMIEAFEQSSKDWDKLLNANYNALMKKLSKEQQVQLRASQREWIKYRDLEYTFNANFYASFGGTTQGINIMAYQCSFVRERALALGAYLEEFEGM